jgi:hypothetical protein
MPDMARRTLDIAVIIPDASPVLTLARIVMHVNGRLMPGHRPMRIARKRARSCAGFSGRSRSPIKRAREIPTPPNFKNKTYCEIRVRLEMSSERSNIYTSFPLSPRNKSVG